MRTINKILGSVVAVLLFAMLATQKTQAQPGVSVSFQTFYDELSPYGTWVDDPDYGDVWVPDAEEGFKPYASRGHWAFTDYGNTWVSDYEWGWAPFHYGRWRYDDYYGWEWIPGSEWGPAWVNWRTGGDYYAWAPLGPRISIDISFGNDYIIPDDYWICAPRRYIASPYIYNYYVPRARVVTIIRTTTIINNVYVNNNRRFVAGPRREDIQRYSGRPVRVYQLGNASRPGATVINNNTINVYRPTVIRNTRGDDRPRPTRVVDANAYRNQHPNDGIANRGNNGATIRHENASRLAQTARDPQATNNNVVRVNRPGAPNPSNGNNTPNNGSARPTRDNGAQPGQPATNNNPAGQNNNNNNRPGRDRNQPQPTPTAVPNTNAPADQNNNGRFGRNRNTGQPTTTTPPNQQAPANNPATTPAPTTDPNNGRFNRNRGNRPAQNNPAVNQPQQQAQPQQDQAARQQAEQAAQQQRQQQDQQRQQAAQQQRQQQEQQRQEMIQRNLQNQQGRQQQMQRPQPQPQQQQPQAQPQQQRPQPQQQPQQQRPQPQPQQQRPQPQQRPQRQEEHKDQKPPM